MASKVIKKFISSVLVLLGSILLWIVLLAATPNDGPRGWAAYSVVGGFIAIIYIWSSGWTSNKEDTHINMDEKKDLFKLK